MAVVVVMQCSNPISYWLGVGRAKKLTGREDLKVKYLGQGYWKQLSMPNNNESRLYCIALGYLKKSFESNRYSFQIKTIV